jgi:hypothetical protein
MILWGTGFMAFEQLSLLRLRVVTDADPLALVRVLERFQNLNILPRKVTAELCFSGVFHVEVDVTGLAEDILTIVAAKLAASTCIRTAHRHRAC